MAGDVDALADLRRAESLVDDVEQTREQLRADARRQLGITGDDERATPPLRQTLATYGLSWYPLIALGLLSIVDTFFSYGFTVLAPDISRTLSVGKGAVAGVIALKTVAVAVAPLPMAALVERRPRRALLCLVTAVAWSLVSIATGFTVLVWGLLAVAVADGLSTGSVSALHPPLLLDSYPPEARVRALSAYQGANSVGNVLAPLAVAVLSVVIGLTWRGVFVVFGLVSLLATLAASRLRDPGVGRFDLERIRAAVRAHRGAQVEQSDSSDTELRFFEIVRRLMLIPSVRRVLTALAVLGVLLIPYQTFLFFFLEEQWGLGPGGRGVFFAYLAGGSIVAVALVGRHGERRFRQDPGRLVRLAAVFLGTAVVLICVGGLAPWFWLMALAFGGASALVACLNPLLSAVLLSIVPARMRPHGAALAGIFLGGVGGIAGAILLSGIDRRYGVTGTMVSLLLPGVFGAIILASTSRLVGRDLDRMIDEVIEEEEIRQISHAGGHLPMLACRGVDFSYGQLQVLFDVNFTVDDGEMVALLGVNGAGKSTLLKAISGIGLPTRGTVRFRGTDITYLDAERRLRLGITQIPGGRAVFGGMSVQDNLLTYAHTIISDRQRVHTAIDRCLEAFPRLAERRHQPAGTLSGGEQQMLALSKALILRPRLLLIDELSLGLAPVVVGQLLDMVRTINGDGTAVVLVEQSVNIALNLVDHAYFMEKGQVRFDGPSKDLLARDDLLRAVFLEGVAAANGAGSATAPDPTRNGRR